eukprot:gnl/Spiro4/24738_TR12293_c0_g1_i1.p1 gnl/Spiro4/24738_TR12293_c0_g1~~gnl/Spiro4/24738_TR12293_c0_g1_i1.p1  ORF type:complete len:648 (+),score=173.65 gnl/Spiro4/24738_TR12293_c0_g1_i1:41-1945(+)
MDYAFFGACSATAQIADALDQFLLTRTFLTSTDRCSLEDCSLAKQLEGKVPPSHINLTRWYNTVINGSTFKAVHSACRPKIAAPAAAGGAPQTKSAQKRAEKAAEKAANTKKSDKDIEAREYMRLRTTALAQSGVEVYPHKFEVSVSLPEFRKSYDNLVPNQELPEKKLTVAGRVRFVRPSGEVHFLVLQAEDVELQVLINASSYGGGDLAANVPPSIAGLRQASCLSYEQIIGLVRRGDIVGVRGFPGRSKTGELSVVALGVALLSPCLHMLPKKSFTNLDSRYRQRYLDLIMNSKPRHIFHTRSRTIKYIRKFLDDRNFLEVETPILNMIPSGATARPFKTKHNELNMTLSLRIAPELWLKQLVIGGYDRVYEIGRLFRNEGMDRSHNPEFTTCEFYQAYADYHDLMNTTEDMLSGLVAEVTGSTNVTFHLEGPEKPATVISFAKPFRRIGMLEGLVEYMPGFVLPNVPLESQEFNTFLINQGKANNVEFKEPLTTSRLIDQLVGAFVEPKCVQPTFIIDHPQLMSPLAKWHRDRPGLTERFELFIGGREYANAYTELNDPAVQRRCFESQLEQATAGDEEAQQLDEDYCKAMEYGLPPTGGWGLGIDRLTMLLTDSHNIQEVLLFPAMKPE